MTGQIHTVMQFPAASARLTAFERPAGSALRRSSGTGSRRRGLSSFLEYCLDSRCSHATTLLSRIATLSITHHFQKTVAAGWYHHLCESRCASCQQ